MPRRNCCLCRASLHAADGHCECVSCLGAVHAETALTEMECPHCKDMSLSSLRSQRAFFLESNSTPRVPHSFPLERLKSSGRVGPGVVSGRGAHLHLPGSVVPAGAPPGPIISELHCSSRKFTNLPHWPVRTRCGSDRRELHYGTEVVPGNATLPAKAL